MELFFSKGVLPMWLHPSSLILGSIGTLAAQAMLAKLYVGFTRLRAWGKGGAS